MSAGTALALPLTDLPALRLRVARLAEPRPAVYRMLDPAGRVLYVGKAKRLRARLLSYFRARYPADKGARILHAAHDIAWDYVPSEFAAYLTELRLIRQYRPPFNVQMNRTRRATFVTVGGGVAPRITCGAPSTRPDALLYGPFGAPGRVALGVRTLNDLLGIRDCAERMPIVFAGQGDLFESPQHAACPRYDFGLCLGPCAGLVAESDYRRRIGTAIAFLEGRTIQPIDRIVAAMSDHAARGEFELAARWRERFESLEWLLAASTRSRSAIEVLTFVYRDPGVYGDDRAYLVRHGTVRAAFPFPTTPIEREAFVGVVKDELARPAPATGPLAVATLDEVLLVMGWFRRHPDALRRTTPLEEWV